MITEQFLIDRCGQFFDASRALSKGPVPAFDSRPDKAKPGDWTFCLPERQYLVAPDEAKLLYDHRDDAAFWQGRKAAASESFNAAQTAWGDWRRSYERETTPRSARASGVDFDPFDV